MGVKEKTGKLDRRRRHQLSGKEKMILFLFSIFSASLFLSE